MHTIDLVNQGLERLRSRGIKLRYLPDAAVTYGLCRIAGQTVLVLNESSTAAEQLPLIVDALRLLQTQHEQHRTPNQSSNPGSFNACEAAV